MNPNPNHLVIINGRVLARAEIVALEQLYRFALSAGSYWYDPVSGMYGVHGHAASGLMRPGHAFGSPARNASGGNTGVLLNGRELPISEWVMWSSLFKAPIQPGAYWLDANGSYGFGVTPSPMTFAGNLYQLGQRQGAGPSSWGQDQDNFWWTRHAAGNSSADGSEGYISLPGGGSVTWGM